MKKIIIAIAVIIMAVAAGIYSNINSTRDYEYEAFCDSIWENNPDYYLDVLVETPSYEEYIEINGEWW